MGVIHWCGGEEASFLNSYGVPVSSTTTSSYFRTGGFARCAIRPSIPWAISRSKPFRFGPITNFWLSAYYYHYDYYTVADQHLFGVGKLGTNSVLWIGFDNPKARLRLFKSDGTELTYDAILGSYTTGVHKLDVHIQNFGVSATVDVYIDMMRIMSVVGDVTLADMPNVDCFVLGGGDYCWMSELIVSEDDSRTLGLLTLYDNAAGDKNEWSGSHLDVDESSVNYNDVIWVNQSNKAFLANVNAPPVGAFSVKTVKREAIALASEDAAVHALELGVKSGGVESYDADPDVLPAVWTAVEHYIDTDPSTGLPFDYSALDSLQSAIVSVGGDLSVSPSASLSPSASGSPSASVSPSRSPSASGSPSTSVSPS